MTFPDLKLDERDFQSLVNEARGRVAVLCPEWTEHNVSDPGITLIEQFAWMTEMLVYRLNCVPDKLHVELLKLLGIELAPPAAARADLRFTLAGPPIAPIPIPAEHTEVTTAETNGGEPIVFRVAEDFTIEPLAPIAFMLQRSGTVHSVPVVDGVARASPPGQPAYSAEPRVGDALYLGFDKPIGRLVLRVDVDGSRAQGVGINPEAPPLIWEVSKEGGWAPVNEVLADTTAGFNKARGSIELQMPERSGPATIGGRRAHWLRCRVVELTRFGAPSPRYVYPPRIQSITATPIGALLPAENSITVEDEVVGESDGVPGQRFRLRHQPALEMRRGERLEMLEPGSKDWVPWTWRESFHRSDPDDHHYRFDPATGEILLGPAIRQRAKTWKQLGYIPPKGAKLRLNRYRYGGGAGGSVAAGTLTKLRTPIAGIGEVTNPRPSEGAVEAESIAAGRLRAAQELRSVYRAVSAEDFEFLAGEASVNVCRARCGAPEPGRAIPVYVLPKVLRPARQLSYDELTPRPRLLEQVAGYLDERRLVGSKVDVLPVPLRAVTVVVDALVDNSAHSNEVRQRIVDALNTFVNPIVGGSLDGEADGWEFGRALNEGELYGLVHDVQGVLAVRMVRIYETDLRTPDKPRPDPVDTELRIEPNELLCSAEHRVRTRHPDEPER